MTSYFAQLSRMELYYRNGANANCNGIFAESITSTTLKPTLPSNAFRFQKKDANQAYISIIYALRFG